MPGTITISTLSDGTNSTSATNPIRGSAKAWVAYNGVTQTVLASYNVSSVVRDAAGIYIIVFTNPFADGNYSVVGMSQQTGGNAYLLYGYIDTPYTASQFKVATSTTAVVSDTMQLSLAVFK